MGMKTTINIKADFEVKENAQRIAQELGLPLSGIINAYLKQFIRDKGINISAVQPRLKPEVEALYMEMEKDFKTGKNLSPVFTNVKDMDKYLDSLK